MTRGSVGCGALGLVLLAACGSASTARDRHGPAALRLCESPHSYLRATNHHLLREMCAGATLGPTVNLHGDLHLEQYVVTHDGSGIVDFDDTALGPVELDLAHLAVSIRLTAQARGWDGGAAWRAFLSGYGEGLSHPDGHSDAVEFDRRLRSAVRFAKGRAVTAEKFICAPICRDPTQSISLLF